MRAVVLGAALLLSLASARTVAAVCTAADVMHCGASCFSCSGNTCTIGKLLTVSPPTGTTSCLFDFGSRDIVLASGGFTSGANAFEIRAHSLTVAGSGTLKATGNLVTPGGAITVTLTGGGFTLLKTANPIDVTGAEGSGPVLAGGGSVIIQSDGNVVLGGTILADGTTTNASGGTIMVTAGRLSGTTVVSSGNVTVTNVLSSGSGANGLGGTIAFTANGTTGAGKIDIENKVIALGGLGGGTISLDATGDVVLGINPNGGPLLIADANGNAGCGGTIDVLAGGNVHGNNGLTSPLVARGSAAALASDGGGGGGMISIEAQRGTVDLEGGGLGGIAANGGINGCGGGVCINTDTPGAGITTAVPISANASGPTSLGGCIQLCSSGAALVHDDLDASGGCGGLAEVDTLQALTVEPPTHSIHADATTGLGGCVVLSSGGSATVSSLLNADTTATAAGGGGGEVDVLSNVSNGSGMVSAPVNVSGSGPNPGGVIDIEAGSDLTIGSTATLNADGGTSGSDGGTLILVAGSPDLPGKLTLSGQAHAKGTSSGVGSAQARLTGCTVAIGATGSLDTTGDTQAANFIVARNMLNITAGASIRTTGVDPTSRNFVTVPSGSPVPGGPAFFPPIAATDVTFAPPCTAFNTPPNCLTPCPVCGNGVVEYPETCDNGASNGPCKPCGPTCRIIDCNDNNPCTTDTCDPIVGCSNTFIPGCTTTTTTVATTSTITASTSSTTSTSPTTTTTASTATTTTLATTTSTATSTITTSTVTSTTAASTSSTTTSTSPTTSLTTSTATTTTVAPTTSTVTSTITTSTVASTTTVSTSPEASTTTQASTTTTLPCTSARCILDAARADPACAAQNVPSSVVAKFGKAETLIDEAGTSPEKKARKLHATAKRVLRAAERVTKHLESGKKLSVECAAALKSAVDRVVATL